jgi:polysaccharide biosynthesis transport protein
MKKKPNNQIKTILDMAYRRKKILISFFLISLIAGVGQYSSSPKMYKASARVIYQRQKINPSKLSPESTEKTMKMVSTLSQQVTSRTNLEKIIKEFNLYSEELEKLPVEYVIVEMRDNINIKSTRGDVFNVVFSGPDPKKVELVTNALAAKFIEENLRYRAEKAGETSSYVKDELAMAKKIIDRKEQSMRDFKLKNYNEMPQQVEINISRLNSLQSQYNSTQSGIRDFERTKILIQEQINLRKETIAAAERFNKQEENLKEANAPRVAPKEKTTKSEDDLALEEINEKIKKARSYLDSLRVKYTDKHPDVKKAKSLLEKNEAEYAALTDNKQVEEKENTKDEKQENEKPEKETLAGGTEKSTEEKLPRDPQLEQLALQLKEVIYNIDNLQETGKEITKQIELVKKWINATPVREAEWTALTRDYEQYNNHYQELVAMDLAAESIKSLERRQQGSQFKIIDPARFPAKPYKPVFFKILCVSIFLGLGAGVGLAFILETMDSSFKNAEELETFIELPVVCAIPDIPTENEKKRAGIINALWVVFLGGAGLIIFGAIAYFIYQGRIII